MVTAVFNQESMQRCFSEEGWGADHASTMVSLEDGPINTRGSAEGSEYVIVCGHPAAAGKPGAEESKQPRKDVPHNPGDAPHKVPTWSKAGLVAGKEDVWRGLGGTYVSGFSEEPIPGDRKHGVESSTLFNFKKFLPTKFNFTRSRENATLVTIKLSPPLEFIKDALGANSTELILLRADEGLEDIGEGVEEEGAALVVITRAFAAAPTLQPILFPMPCYMFLSIHMNQ